MSTSRRLTTAALATAAVGVSLGVAGGAFADHGGSVQATPTPAATTPPAPAAAPVADQHGQNRGPENRGHHQRGRDHHGVDFRSGLVGSLPAGPPLNGVTPGGLPWTIGEGSVRLRPSGRLRVRIFGLVLPPPGGTNTAGGVTTVTASVFCGGATTAAATTTAVPLSQAGNASIDQNVVLTGGCLAPVVLINPNGAVAKYIAASGF